MFRNRDELLTHFLLISQYKQALLRLKERYERLLFNAEVEVRGYQFEIERTINDIKELDDLIEEQENEDNIDLELEFEHDYEAERQELVRILNQMRIHLPRHEKEVEVYEYRLLLIGDFLEDIAELYESTENKEDEEKFMIEASLLGLAIEWFYICLHNSARRNNEDLEPFHEMFYDMLDSNYPKFHRARKVIQDNGEMVTDFDDHEFPTMFSHF